MSLADKADKYDGQSQQDVGRATTTVDRQVIDSIKAQFGASTNKEAGYLLDYAFHDSMGNEEKAEEALEKFEEHREE